MTKDRTNEIVRIILAAPSTLRGKRAQITFIRLKSDEGTVQVIIPPRGAPEILNLRDIDNAFRTPTIKTAKARSW